MAFHNVILPQRYAYGTRRDLLSTHGDFRTDNGDRVVFPDRRTLFRWQLTYTNRTAAQMAALRAFWYCRFGPVHSFKFQEFQDFTSAADGVSSPAGTDQAIVTVNSKRYLAKNYGTYYRIIKFPVSGSVIITDGGSVVTGSCTINYSTGEITGYTPSGAFKAGFQFYNHVRFTKEAFNATPTDYGEYRVDVGVAELLESAT